MGKAKCHALTHPRRHIVWFVLLNIGEVNRGEMQWINH